MGQIAEIHAALRGHAWKCSFTSPDEWEEIQDTTNERFVSSEKDSLSFFAAISKYIVRYSLNRFANLFFTNRHRSRGWRKILSKQSYRYNFDWSIGQRHTLVHARFTIRTRKEIIDFRSEFSKKKKKSHAGKKSAARVKQRPRSYEIRFVFVVENLFHSMSHTMELRSSHVRSLKRNFYHRVERPLDRYYYSNEK